MKRRTFISMMSVMAAAGVLTLSGCSNSSTSTAASSGASSAAGSSADQLAAIQASGKLIVALEGAWQPWSYHDESDTLVGYDVEVSRAIAEKLGVEPEYVESDWDSLFAGLDAGRFDMVCNGVEVTDERALTYDFTTPYGYIHTALAVRKDNDEIKTFEDLKGKTTANSLASTYMELAESYGATVQGIDTLEETIQLLFHVDIERVAMTEDEETESDEDEAVNAAEAVMGLDGEAAATGESAPAEPETDDEAEKTTIDELADEQKNEKGIVGMQPISHAEGKVPANKRPKSEELHSPWADGRTFPGTGKNAQCPCGSGRKYKMCHGQNEQ